MGHNNTTGLIGPGDLRDLVSVKLISISGGALEYNVSATPTQEHGGWMNAI